MKEFDIKNKVFKETEVIRQFSLKSDKYLIYFPR